MPAVTPEEQASADWINNQTVGVYEACQITHLSHMTLRRRIKQKRIRAVLIAGNWRIYLADLDGLR
jgi:excisionase family DNA binding protein